MKKRKVCVVTGTRAEYGLLYPVLKEIQSRKELSLQLVVTNAHLATEFGLTYKEIQKDVIIGNSTKIQSHSFICELVTIGNNCFIGHGVMFINDLFKNNGPAMGNKLLWSKTFIGDNVSIGSNATILPVQVCNNVVIGAGAVVTKDILLPGTYAGNPAKKI